MKYLYAVFILAISMVSQVSGQNIEIPETVITGQDRSTYKTPILVYPHEFQINFPEPPDIPAQYLKKKEPLKQSTELEADSNKNLKELTLCAGKFGYVSSAISLKYPGLYFNFSALHDNSFRNQDSKKIIEAHIQKSFKENMEFNFDLWNCIKELPQIDSILTEKKKHTVMTDTKLLFRGQNYSFSIGGIKNSLGKLEETNFFIIFEKHNQNITFGTEAGFDKFSEEENRIISIYGGYHTENWQATLSVKNIGNEIRVLPSAAFLTEKNGIKLEGCFSSRFSFPQLWKQAGEQPYLDMKNEFLTPEEIYSISTEISGKTEYLDFSIKGQLSYEKTGYHWKDKDSDKIYEPSILKNNFTGALSITLRKNFEKFDVESNYTCFHWEEKKSGYPENTCYIRACFETGKLKNQLQLSHTGRQNFDGLKIKGYNLLSAIISYQTKPDLNLFFIFNNILGKNYQIAPGYRGRPFDFIAGFQTRW